jgi:hypothetical protein
MKYQMINKRAKNKYVSMCFQIMANTLLFSSGYFFAQEVFVTGVTMLIGAGLAVWMEAYTR